MARRRPSRNFPLLRRNSESAKTDLHRLFVCATICSLWKRLPRSDPARPPLRREIPGRDQANDLSVTVGKSALVDFTKPVIRVAIGLSEIAEATAVSPTEVMVNGKARQHKPDRLGTGWRAAVLQHSCTYQPRCSRMTTSPHFAANSKSQCPARISTSSPRTISSSSAAP